MAGVTGTFNADRHILVFGTTSVAIQTFFQGCPCLQNNAEPQSAQHIAVKELVLCWSVYSPDESNIENLNKCPLEDTFTKCKVMLLSR